MKQILIALALALSCSSYRCCKQPFEEVYAPHPIERSHNAYKPPQDAFHASTLIGLWQFDYGVSVGFYELKEVEFSSDGYCDIVMEDMGIPNRYTKTLHWFINNGYLSFDSGSTYEERLTFSFKIMTWIFPILTIEDGFGNYEMRKLK